jgi:hypothetical protein
MAAVGRNPSMPASLVQFRLCGNGNARKDAKLSLCIAIERLCGAGRLPLLPDEAPEPPQRHNEQKEQRVMQTEPAPKGQSHRQTQQTGQNTYHETTDPAGPLSSSSNPEGQKQRQYHLKPRHQFGADARGKMINGSLVGSAPSSKSQPKRVDSNDDNRDQEAEGNDRKRSAQDTAPADF